MDKCYLPAWCFETTPVSVPSGHAITCPCSLAVASGVVCPVIMCTPLCPGSPAHELSRSHVPPTSVVMHTNSLTFPLLTSCCDVFGLGAIMAWRSPVAGETVRGCPPTNTFCGRCGGVGIGALCRALTKWITSLEIVLRLTWKYPAHMLVAQFVSPHWQNTLL
jgi:hypothetical protein